MHHHGGHYTQKRECDSGHGSTSEMAFYNQPPQTFIFPPPLTSVTGTCQNKDKDEMEKKMAWAQRAGGKQTGGNVFFLTQASQLF